MQNYKDQRRATILDNLENASIDQLVLHTQIIADALASHIYNISSSQIFNNSLVIHNLNVQISQYYFYLCNFFPES